MRACPACHAGPLQLTQTLAAKPIGTFSLAGAQMKVSAEQLWKLACPSCSWYAVGHIEGGTYDPETQTMTGGHLVPRLVVTPGDGDD
jgi:hypothetical protein